MQVLVFPGQGSQHIRMGERLFDEVREFSAVEGEADALLGYSVRKLCLEDPDKRLKQTQYTQPCLYVVNALHYYKALSEGRQASYVAGHSLGEYNALLGAGVFDFITGLRLVQKRGELMARTRNGAMAAVIGLSPETLTKILADNQLTTLDVANYNSPGQTVVSGVAEDISRAGPILERAGAQLYMVLPVSAAFHSRYMADAASAFDDFLRCFRFTCPAIPVVSNVTGQFYPSHNPDETVRSLLVKQITAPVLWMQSIRFLLSKGASTFTEIGPGKVLTRLIGQIQGGA